MKEKTGQLRSDRKWPGGAGGGVLDRGLAIDPLNRLRFEISVDGATGVGPAAAFEAADDANCHVLFDGDLAGETDAGSVDVLSGENVFLSLRHPRRFAIKEFDTAGGAFRLAAAGVELIDARVFRKSEHKSLAVGNFKELAVFESQSGHENRL